MRPVRFERTTGRFEECPGVSGEFRLSAKKPQMMGFRRWRRLAVPGDFRNSGVPVVSPSVPLFERAGGQSTAVD